MRDLDKPLKYVKRPPAWAKPRHVRLKSAVSLRTFLAAVMRDSKHCTAQQKNYARRCKLAIEFAIETSLRRGEVAAIKPTTNFLERWAEGVTPACCTAS